MLVYNYEWNTTIKYMLIKSLDIYIKHFKILNKSKYIKYEIYILEKF